MLTLQREWREARREGRVYWLCLVIFLVMLGVMISVWHSHHSLLEQKQQVAESERQRWLNQGEKDPHSAAHYGVYVIKPGSPLAIVEPGLNPFQGQTLLLEAHKQSEALFRPIQDAIPMQRFGELTPGFAIQMLLPLLMILLGFQSLAGERERGTLKQLLVAGASPSRIFWSKAGSLLSLGLLFLMPVMMYLLLIAPVLADGFVASDWLRCFAMALCYLVYLLIWVLLTLFVSALSKSSRIALVTLLIVWASLCLLMPKIAMEWATQSVSLDSARLFQSRMESEIYTPERLAAIEKYKRETLAKHQVDDVDDLPFDWSGAQLLFSEDYGNRVFDRLYRERSTALERQTSGYTWFGLVSPLINVQLFSMAAATSDLKHHQLFSEAAERHRRAIQLLLNGDLKQHGQSLGGGYQAGLSLWQQVPEFRYSAPVFTLLLPYYVKPMLFLCLWLVFTLIAGNRAARHLGREGWV